MPRKLCACCYRGIRPNQSLCNRCAKEYGLDREKWDQWLKNMVASHQKEWIYSIRHDELDIFDEVTIPAEPERWTYSEANQNIRDANRCDPNMDIEDFVWFCQDTA